MLPPDLLKVRRNRDKLAVHEFVQGAATGSPERMGASIEGLEFGSSELGGGWVSAMRSVSRLQSVPNATRKFFLGVFIRHGDHLRQECGNDLVLADGLRMLLPKYSGPAMRLYRGEGFRNRSRRTYGLSWSASHDVATCHATGLWRQSKGGSVVLETLAPREAIICKVPRNQDRHHEEEYIVDRRCLMTVKVIDRFSESDVDDMQSKRGAK